MESRRYSSNLVDRMPLPVMFAFVLCVAYAGCEKEPDQDMVIDTNTINASQPYDQLTP